MTLEFRRLQYRIPASLAGSRIDQALSLHPEVNSRSRAAKLIQSGWVRLAGRAVKPSHIVAEGHVYDLQIPIEQKSELLPYDLPLHILYEDQDVLVLNKPAGLVIHPAAGHHSDTLVNALVHHAKDLSMGFAENRPGIVHRLDRDTSGVLVVAKNDFSQSVLSHQFREKTVHRVYWAIVYGPLKNRKGTLQSHLKRHPTDRKKFASERLSADQKPTGKLAITHYEHLRTHSSGISWIKCQLETGRTHQIRVHLSEAGHPIVGDQVYGSNSRLQRLKSPSLRERIRSLGRLGLHAVELAFTHPTNGKRLEFTVPWPNDLAGLANELGFS